MVGGGPKDGQLLCNNGPASLRISVTMTFIVHRQITKASTRTAPVFQLSNVEGAKATSRDHTLLRLHMHK